MNIVEPIREKDDIEAMKQFLFEWNPRNYMLFITGINTGLRISDIRTLKVAQVAGTYINIRDKKTGKTTKRKMTPTLKRELHEYIKGKRMDEYLFKSRNGRNKPISRQTAYHILKVAAEECGLDNVGTHTMRKTYGYHLYRKEKDVAMLMEQFNHSDQGTTLRYIGIKQDQQDRVMSRFKI